MYGKHDCVFQIINKNGEAVYIIAKNKREALNRLNNKKLNYDKEFIVATNKGLVRDIMSGFFTELSQTLGVSYEGFYSAEKEWEFELDLNDTDSITGTTLDFDNYGDMVIALTRNDDVIAAWLYPDNEAFEDIMKMCTNVKTDYTKEDNLYCFTFKNPEPEDEEDEYLESIIIASDTESARSRFIEKYGITEYEQCEELGNAEEHLNNIFEAVLDELDANSESTYNKNGIITEHVIYGEDFKLYGYMQTDDMTADDMIIKLRLNNEMPQMFGVADPDIVESIVASINK